MRSPRVAAGAAATACIAVATLAVPTGATASAETPATAKAAPGFALVTFKAPKAKTLRIPRSGRCVSPKFGWKVVTNYTDSMFGGSAKVKSRGKRYGSMSNRRYSVNQQQYLKVAKPVCKPGTYTVTVKGKVTSDRPIDGYTYETYERVSGSTTYRVTKAR